jgi:SAM-dependent methyltransferase
VSDRVDRVHRLYKLLGARFRARRMAAFLEWYHGPSGGSILDVGGTQEFWLDAKVDERVTILNVLPAPEDLPANLTYVQGSATSLPFEDRSFDVVFSNSMIEHLGERRNQQRFASEALRVGRRVWIQTPNRWFPIESHLITPLVHYLPRSMQRRLLRNFTIWGWLTRPDQSYVDSWLDEIALLSARDMRLLFPGCTLLRERGLGMTKSLIAVKPAATAPA